MGLKTLNFQNTWCWQTRFGVQCTSNNCPIQILGSHYFNDEHYSSGIELMQNYCEHIIWRPYILPSQK